MSNSQLNDSYGRVMLSIEGTTLLPHEKDLISNPHVGGIIFFTRNFISRELCQRLVFDKTHIKNALTGKNDPYS